MKPFTCSHSGALLCLSLFLQAVVASHVDPIRRQETTLSTTAPPTSTTTNGRDGSLSSSISSSDRDEKPQSTANSPVSVSVSDSSVEPTSTSTLNTTLFHNIIPEGQLPLAPAITPGWAVAGVILVVTGVVYALIGIKTRWLHTFFSTAFLASLGTTVLIVYVMVPPVSNAIQGAYVVAVVCTGLILGALAVVFREVTECLGCLLGGFCLSMWLLALQPGGLIARTGGKVGFIAAFTLAAFCLYFTKWTRNYGLIACISFSGATVAVLGIDCFSRAGLREFWAYLWALNDNLFPIGVVTYPLTRGIRVELAVTILIFLAGIVSQLKLWRIIKERRDKRNAEIAEGERNLRVEEEEVGRQIEEMTTRERREWERVYGDGSGSQVGDSVDSGVGDMESEKKARRSNGASVTVTSRPQSPMGTDDGAERDKPPTNRAATPLSLAKALAAAEVESKGRNSCTVTVKTADGASSPVRVASPVAGSDAASVVETNLSSANNSKQGAQVTPPPTVVPLPFRIPETQEDDERSSVATFAGGEDEDAEPKPHRLSRTELLARRLSGSSAKLLRSLSQRSANKKPGNKPADESREGLVDAVPHVKDENDSVIATLDGLSSAAGSARSSLQSLKLDLGVALSAERQVSSYGKGAASPGSGLSSSDALDGKLGLEDLVLTVSTGAIELEALDIGHLISEGTTKSEEVGKIVTGVVHSPQEVYSKDEADKARRKSTASVDSVPASLKMENLPAALSRVALSYRTNEWAKHLDDAEVPEPDSLPSSTQSELSTSPIPSEKSAPLDVIDLQQTAENAMLPIAAPRSASAMSRSSSRGSLLNYPDPAVLGSSTLDPQPKGRSTPFRTASGTLKARSSVLLSQPIAEETDSDSLPAPLHKDPSALQPAPIPQLSTSTSTPNLYVPPASQTLIGMRETIIRNKASYSHLIPQHQSLEPLPTIPSRPSSDAGSVYNQPLDLDDLPLSQRRALIHRNSLNFVPATHKPSRSSLRLSQTPTTPATAETAAFDSHQPLRRSIVPPEAIRQTQLANFRSSVAADLRPVAPPGLVTQAVNARGETGFTHSTSMMSLRGAYSSGDWQRSVMLGQMDVEAQRREAERIGAEGRQREFEERMRSGQLMEAHRDALRRMQGGVRDL